VSGGPAPTPTLRGEERIYFEEARNRRLVHQRCDDCGERIFYLRTVCPSCWSERLTVCESKGRGVVHTFTTQYRPGHPAFADRVPYTAVLVDLEEGVRVLADLVDCAPEDVHVGMPVSVVFDDVTEELTLPRFRPEGAQ
jgi:uncharacterized protein